MVDIDWSRLLHLRDSFLEGRAGHKDYWRDEALLRDYDATFGRRIAWKWDWVIADLQRRGWTPPDGTVLDWGCGSGVAIRTWVESFPVPEAVLQDRSPLAVRWASEALRREFPGIALSRSAAPALVLVSHVLSELSDGALSALLDQLRRVQSFVWVEPGTFAQSRALIAVRETLLEEGFHAVAPCVHQQKCGMLAAENGNHWCHHFARPPGNVFMDAFWSHFSRLMGVDLRSLPLSYLVMDRRPAPPVRAGAVRILGRPRVYKPYALLLGCDAPGVRERSLPKRQHPEWFRALKHHAPLSLQTWNPQQGDITELGEW